MPHEHASYFNRTPSNKLPVKGDDMDIYYLSQIPLFQKILTISKLSSTCTSEFVSYALHGTCFSGITHVQHNSWQIQFD